MPLNPNLTALWRVSSPYTAPVTLRATDWISALGAALHQLGRSQHINRMACERLPNGEVIINDLTHDSRYVIQQLAAAEDLLEVGADPDHSTTERAHAASAALPVRGTPAAGDADELLAMGDSSDRVDPYGRWGMFLDLDPEDDDLFSEAQPRIETDTPRSRALFPTGTPATAERATIAAGHVSIVLEEGPLEMGDGDLDTEELPLAMGCADAEADELRIEAAFESVAGDEPSRAAGESPWTAEAVPTAEEPALPMDFEDVFSFEEDDLSALSDEITLIEASPRRRRLSSALKEIRARRTSKRSTP